MSGPYCGVRRPASEERQQWPVPPPDSGPIRARLGCHQPISAEHRDHVTRLRPIRGENARASAAGGPWPRLRTGLCLSWRVPRLGLSLDRKLEDKHCWADLKANCPPPTSRLSSSCLVWTSNYFNMHRTKKSVWAWISEIKHQRLWAPLRVVSAIQLKPPSQRSGGGGCNHQTKTGGKQLNIGDLLSLTRCLPASDSGEEDLGKQWTLYQHWINTLFLCLHCLLSAPLLQSLPSDVVRTCAYIGPPLAFKPQPVTMSSKWSSGAIYDHYWWTVKVTQTSQARCCPLATSSIRETVQLPWQDPFLICPGQSLYIWNRSVNLCFTIPVTPCSPACPPCPQAWARTTPASPTTWWALRLLQCK